MKIEVWKKGFFGTAKRLPYGLSVFAFEGSAYASWKHGAVIVCTSRRIGVSNELGVQLLRATVEPCPHAGELPDYGVLKGIFGTGYTVREQPRGEDSYTLEHCTRCGYTESYVGDPRLRAAVLRRHGLDKHPQLTRLVPGIQLVRPEEADWDEADQLLAPSRSDGRLIVWVRGRWPMDEATRVFPEARVVYEQEQYAILTIPG